MSKVICDLISKNINKYQICDGIIINSQEYSIFSGKKFSLEESILLAKKCKKKNILSFLNVDRIIEESEIDNLKNYLLMIIDNVDYIIFSDISIYYLVKTFNNDFIKKLIFDAKTVIASYEDLSYYKSLGLECFLNNELSFEEIKEISTKSDFSFEVYGFHQIFYSKRELISLFTQYKEINNLYKNKKMYLVEETREDKYLIYEGDYGTIIYTPYIYSIFEEIMLIKNKINFIRIDGVFLKENDLIEVVKCYNVLLKSDDKIDQLIERLLSINNNLSKGFLNLKSILLKGKDYE